MTNRAGEFDLVIDPGNDDHLVSHDQLSAIVGDLTGVIRVGMRNLVPGQGHDVALFHSASPEQGSVRFNLVAAALALSVAADFSQLVGINLLTIFQGVAWVVSEPAAIPRPTPPLQDEPQFVAAVERLVETAASTGYSSVRIETPNGLNIELIGATVPPYRVSSAGASMADIRALQQRLTELHGAIAALDSDLGQRLPNRTITPDDRRDARRRRDLVSERDKVELQLAQALGKRSVPGSKRGNP